MPRTSSRTGDASAGFTLMEMLVVIAVISILMGIGAGFTVRFTRGMELESEAAKVISSLETARLTAQATGNNATLRFAKHNDTTTLRVTGRDTVGAFTMDDAAGAYGATFDPGTAVFVNGVLGRALALAPGQTVDLGASPRWDFADGFYVTCQVYVTALAVVPPADAAPLIVLPDRFKLELVPAGGQVRLRGTVTLADLTTVTIEPFSLPFDYCTWTRVGFGVADRVLRLTVGDAVVADVISFVGDLNTAATGNLRLLDAGALFTGRVDELVLCRWGVLSEASLGGSVELKELETRLADADPFNDFVDIVYTPEGMLLGGADISLNLVHALGGGRTLGVLVAAAGLAQRQ